MRIVRLLVLSILALLACGDDAVRTHDALQVRLVAADGDRGGEAVPPWPGTEGAVLERDVLIDARRIREARVVRDPATDRHGVVITLDDEGTRLLENITARNQPRRLAVVIGGRLAAAAVIRGVITGGRLTIAASSRDDADQMATLLGTGSR